jgi:hypothetical protein
MTKERDFDRLARAWLDAGPNEAPDRVIAAVLHAAETTPQVRRLSWRSIRRSFDMNRLPITATVAIVAIVALGGVLLLGRPGDAAIGGTPSPSIGGTPSPSPTTVPSTSPSASATSATELPASLQYQWKGPDRNLPGIGSSTRMTLQFGTTTFAVRGTTYTTGSVPAILRSDASITPAGDISLVLTGDEAGCHAGDVGTYPWSLSPAGTLMDIKTGTDACPARQAAMSGAWERSYCKDESDDCLGDLVAAGSFSSQYIDPRVATGGAWEPRFGALTFTVPDGWANSSDWPTTFTLTPSADYALETSKGPAVDTFHEIAVQVHPAAAVQNAACTNQQNTTVARTVDGLIGWVAGQRALVVSKATPITIGGLSGRYVDVKLAKDWTGTCPGSTKPAATFLMLADGTDSDWSWGIQGAEQERLIFLDLGDGNVVLIGVDSTYPDRFQQLVADAMPIIATFRFQ